MKKLIPIFTFLILTGISLESIAQINARMLRHPDISKDQIVFTYAGDLWVVPRTGGTALKLSSPPGEENYPKFSPDGKHIAYVANYDGNSDIYVIPSMGGVPKRLTFHGGNDRVLDWSPDGKNILFSSARESGRQRFSQLFTISVEGGQAKKLPLPYGDFASFSPDGKSVALNFQSRVFRTWKRYRGGWAPDIYTFNLEDYSSENITNNTGSDEYPMWHGNKVYYLSDNGEEMRYNLWVYDISTKANTQLTNYKDQDIHFTSIGPDAIVFETGGRMHVYDLTGNQHKEIEIKVVTDQMSLLPKNVNPKSNLQYASISPNGKRVVVTARGELFSVPAKDGYVKNLTNTSGAAERFAKWSPDAKHIAYWSDATGEYQLMVMDVATGHTRKVTNFPACYRYQIHWSPDSKKVAFIDQEMKIQMVDIASGAVTQIDRDLWSYEWNLRNFHLSWSADSRWIAYTKGLENRHDAIFLFDTRSNQKHQVTSGYYNDSSPVFDPEGNYLYILTDRHFSPVYGNIDNSFLYTNGTQIAAIPLRKDVASPLLPKNDEEEAKKEEDSKEEDSGKKSKKGKDKSEKEEKADEVKIDIDGFESRMVMLPSDPGNYNYLRAVKGKVIYHQRPNTGSDSKESPLKYFDLKERESKTILDDANGTDLAANGEKLLIWKNGNLYIVDVSAGQKLENPLRLGEMTMTIHPKEEWQQIFNDAWRIQRDFFYDKKMHGVDWEAIRTQYGALMNDAVTRWDVNYVLGEMIGELNASHTYRGGGDTEQTKTRPVGYLGVDWEVANGHYRIKDIIDGAPWDSEVRSPLNLPGIKVNKGDYVLAVNGIPLEISKEPYAAFEGLAGVTVSLMVNDKPSMTGARTVIVETMRDESRLRHLAWIEANRKRVDEATGGRAGYIYVRSTGIDGQNELVRQFSAQWDKDALIIDERFNSGGQIPDRFIELLNRKPLAYWAVRDGKNWQWPPIGHFGPKAMLINGWSGSGGDAFPDYFRKAGLGPLIGSRTWGGLIGITGAPDLIDGGNITAPTFRMYDPDGEWFKEGHGVDPDIEEPENLTELAKGRDNQLEKAIENILEQLKDYDGSMPKPVPYEKR